MKMNVFVSYYNSIKFVFCLEDILFCGYLFKILYLSGACFTYMARASALLLKMLFNT